MGRGLPLFDKEGPGEIFMNLIVKKWHLLEEDVPSLK